MCRRSWPPQGRRREISLSPLETQAVHDYDDAGKTTSIAHKNGAGTNVDTINYVYDLAGRITQETSTLGTTKNNTYDLTDQVTGDGSSSFTWDANGNRTGTGYTTGTGNQQTADGTWTYSYDAAGNETNKSKPGEYWGLSAAKQGSGAPCYPRRPLSN